MAFFEDPKKILAVANHFHDGDFWWAYRPKPRFGSRAFHLYDFLKDFKFARSWRFSILSR